MLRIGPFAPGSHLRHISGNQFLEMHHPDRETPSDVRRTVKVRPDNDLTSSLSIVSLTAMKRQ